MLFLQSNHCSRTFKRTVCWNNYSDTDKFPVSYFVHWPKCLHRLTLGWFILWHITPVVIISNWLSIGWDKISSGWIQLNSWVTRRQCTLATIQSQSCIHDQTHTILSAILFFSSNLSYHLGSPQWSSMGLCHRLLSSAILFPVPLFSRPCSASIKVVETQTRTLSGCGNTFT